MGKLAKLAGYKPEVEIARSMSGIFCRILLHLEVLLDVGNFAWFRVVDSTKLRKYWVDGRTGVPYFASLTFF